jgi:hypothetical protein
MYKKLLNRISGRSPKSFMSNIAWNSARAMTDTISFYPHNIRMAAFFDRLVQVQIEAKCGWLR